MDSHLFKDESDLGAMRALVEKAGGGLSITNLDEAVQLEVSRGCMRLWREGGNLLAFAWVDPWNNLNFTFDPPCLTPQLEDQLVEWGLTCVRERNASTGEQAALDVPCEASDAARRLLLEGHGFQLQAQRSLDYVRLLREPIPTHPVPSPLLLRPVRGEEEVEALVELHRAAFGTQNMTVEERLAIMRTPVYEAGMDLVAVSPDGELEAFCICWMESPEVGWTDPLGVRPIWQGRGLGRAILAAGLAALRDRGAWEARLGTSSGNLPMQRLAESLGFRLASENLWYSRPVG